MNQYKEKYVEKGGTLEDYILKNYKLSIDEFKEQLREEIENNLKNELIYEAIAKEQNITVDEAGFIAYAELQAKNNGYSSVDELYKAYGDDNDKESGKKYLEKIYLCNKAVDFCVNSAVVTEV